jgi:hypothetical protein
MPPPPGSSTDAVDCVKCAESGTDSKLNCFEFKLLVEVLLLVFEVDVDIPDTEADEDDVVDGGFTSFENACSSLPNIVVGLDALIEAGVAGMVGCCLAL